MKKNSIIMLMALCIWAIQDVSAQTTKSSKVVDPTGRNTRARKSKIYPHNKPAATTTGTVGTTVNGQPMGTGMTGTTGANVTPGSVRTMRQSHIGANGSGNLNTRGRSGTIRRAAGKTNRALKTTTNGIKTGTSTNGAATGTTTSTIPPPAPKR